MSGTTVELNLATAVDADDNADYLTISLANSLRTVDGLFNAVTGHTHGGAHQGGPVAPAAGSIPGTALTNGTVTNAKLASDTARANLLTNPGLEVWSRGSGPFTAASAFAADRWQINLDGGDTLSVSREASIVDPPSLYGAVSTYVKSAGTFTMLFQKLEDLYQLRTRTLSFSARVRASVAGGVRIGIGDSVNGYRYSTANVGTGAFETLTVSAPIASGATYINIAVSFVASCTAYIDNAMLVVGSQYADYAPLHPADDLARCMRYYETDTRQISGLAYATTNATFPWGYKVKKAVTPTITVIGATQSMTGAAGLVTNTATSSSSVFVDGATIGSTVASGLTVGQASVLVGAALVAEGNP